MAFSKQPPLSILPAYRPVAFELYFDTLTSASRGQNAVITIYKDGQSITDDPIRFQSIKNEPSPLAPATDTRWFFEVDIQKFCQDTLAPYPNLTSVFVAPLSKFAYNTDMHGVYYITATYEIIDLATGLLEDSAIDLETSDEFTIFSASKGNLESMFLDDYYGSFVAQNVKFLTKSSRTIGVCKEDNVYLSFITPPDTPAFPNSIDTALVQLYDSSGSLLHAGLTSVLILGSKMGTLNTGVLSLSFATYYTGSVDFTDVELSYYTVSIGEADTGDPIGDYTQITEEFTYKLNKSCCNDKQLRLQWMNRLGGVDSYTFDGSVDFAEVTRSSNGKVALGWNIGSLSPHKSSSEGLYKYDSQSVQQYSITTDLLNNTEALWLSELLSSSKVYIEVDGVTLVACKVQDATQSISRSKGKFRYNLVVTLSNNPINHRL